MVQIYKVNNRRYIQIGEESILYGGFARIYEEFYLKVLFFSCTFVGITEITVLKKGRNYKPFLNEEIKRGLI